VPDTEICQQLSLGGVAAHQERPVHASGRAGERRGISRVADHALDAVGPRPRLACDRVHPDVTRAETLAARAKCPVFADYRDMCATLKPDFAFVLGRHCDMADEARFLIDSRIPFAGPRHAVRRLEIPYGYFERRVQLPDVRVEAATREVVDGCLILKLRKMGETGQS